MAPGTGHVAGVSGFCRAAGPTECVCTRVHACARVCERRGLAREVAGAEQSHDAHGTNPSVSLRPGAGEGAPGGRPGDGGAAHTLGQRGVLPGLTLPATSTWATRCPWAHLQMGGGCGLRPAGCLRPLRPQNPGHGCGESQSLQPQGARPLPGAATLKAGPGACHLSASPASRTTGTGAPDPPEAARGQASI